MESAKRLLWTFAVGSSLLVILSYNIGIDYSIAQEQKFLKNSTSFGNATADLSIKHAPQFSTLTIQPWPIVEPGSEFNVTGILVDKTTLQPVPSSDISFLYESASEAIPSSSLETIDRQNTDADGRFDAAASAPDAHGIVAVTAVYNGSGLYHSVASDPTLVIVSNSTLPP